MSYQSIFRRYEIKYLLTEDQYCTVRRAMEPYMEADRYGRSSVRNIYYDTESYRLIRRSMEKPVYKEKLRLRSYGAVSEDGDVFVELKKKYKGVVYKRRIALPYPAAVRWLEGGVPTAPPTQISREIDYFREYYGRLLPQVYLSYEREAFALRGGGDLRITFDREILAREDDVSLCGERYGRTILPEGLLLMEIKCGGGMPLWMSEVLCANRIYRCSFSKYGRAYEDIIFPRINNNTIQEDKYDVSGSFSRNF